MVNGMHGIKLWGVFDPRYIPSELYATYMLPRFNNAKLMYAWNDKSYYDLYFPNTPFAHTIARRIDNLFVKDDYSSASVSEVADILNQYEEIIIKPSLESGVGLGVEVWDTKNVLVNDLCKKLTEFGSNFVVQELIKQHSFMAAFNASSVNIIRINSFRWHGRIRILSSIIRFGNPGSHTDISHINGVECLNVVGISSDGKLLGTVYNAWGEKKSVTEFGHTEGENVPGYKEALALVSYIHERGLQHFDLVGFDVAIDNEGHPVIIEYNADFPGITFPQYACGPFFGDITTEVISDLVDREPKGLK